MRIRRWSVALVLAASMVGVVAACVGDDPASGGSTPGTDGGGSGDGSTPQDSGGGGTDAPIADGGSDACATADLQQDSHNCGACGHDCMHGECKAGVCQPWVVATVATGSLRGPGTDGTHVYYSVDGQVFRAQVDGGSPVQMTPNMDARAFAKGATGMLVCGMLTDEGIFQLAPNPGTNPTLIKATAQCIALAVDGNTTWAGHTAAIDEIVGATTNQHFLVPFNERLTGGLSTAGNRLYWVNQNTGILNAPKAMPDAGRAALNKDAINEANGLATTDSYAYVTARPAGAGGILLRVSIASGTSTVLLTGLEQATTQQGIAIGPNGALYFAAGTKVLGYVPPP